MRRSNPRSSSTNNRPLDQAFMQTVGSATGKMILCVMFRFGNTSGYCFATIATIAREANCREAAVRRWIKNFVTNGWLIEMPRRPRGIRSFRLNIEGDDTVTGDLTKSSSTTPETVTQNPKNQYLNPPRRNPPEGRPRGPIIPPNATTLEAIAAHRAFREQGVGG